MIPQAAVQDRIESIMTQYSCQKDVPQWSDSFLAVSGVLLQKTTRVVFEVTGMIGGGLGEKK